MDEVQRAQREAVLAVMQDPSRSMPSDLAALWNHLRPDGFEYAIGWWTTPSRSTVEMNSEAFDTYEEAAQYLAEEESQYPLDTFVGHDHGFIIKRPRDWRIPMQGESETR